MKTMKIFITIALALILAIGAEAQVKYKLVRLDESGSDKLYIENSDSSDPLIYGDFATNRIKVNGSFSSGVGTVADNDATPDVRGANTFIYNGTANSVAPTDLDNPVAGNFYTIIGNSDTYTLTIADSGNFELSGSSAVLGVDDVITLYCKADNYYVEISRSNN